MRLVIELDGEIHKTQLDYNEGRTAEMDRFDIRVIRFKNNEIENDIENVIKRVTDVILYRLKSPPWGI